MRQGDWFQTYTGKRFYPIDPKPEDVEIYDIAHSLSLLCRFNGHCRSFYSVAQHSVLVADKLPDELKLFGLLHDAHEAYTGDFISPLKRSDPDLNESLTLIQAKIQHAIIYALTNDNYLSIYKEIKDADCRMLVTEKRDLFNIKYEWKEGENYMPYPDVISPWNSNVSEKAFLVMFQRCIKLKR